MADAKEHTKGLKKELKAQAKLRKKEAKGAVVDASAGAGQPASAEPTGPTPAERSAAAAERQARLHTYRVWIALAGVVLALVTVLVSTRPWERRSEPPPVEQVPDAADNHTP
jgi:hypothetical protein